MIDRRDFVWSGLLGTAAMPLLGWSEIVQAEELTPLARAARDAWIYGLVLIEMAGSRSKLLSSAVPNKIFVAKSLSGPESRKITTPNNDTLYGRSWIDLNAGPVRITLPRTGDRYFSVAFMDMYSNNFAVLGTRTTGGDGGTFTLVGPGAATNDPAAIRSPTPWVWMLSRLLVDSSEDLAAANAIHNHLRVEGPKTAAPRAYADRSARWDSYFDSVQRLIVENPPPPTDTALFRRIGPLGIGPRGGFAANRFNGAQAAEIEAGVAAAKNMLRSAGRQERVVDGWSYPKYNLGNYGQDYLYRAQVSLAGLAALPRVEAMYMRPVDEKGGVLFDSGEDWQLTFLAKDKPPVDAFWSMSMYRATDDGQLFFFDNVIDRYAIGNRTPDLIVDANGGTTIWMSRKDPGPQRRANWLPLPPDGPFAPVFRAYMPRPALLDGDYRLPRMRRA